MTYLLTLDVSVNPCHIILENVMDDCAIAQCRVNLFAKINIQ